MPELKIGIHLPSLRQTFAKALLTVAPWRVQGVEIDARHDFRPAEMTRTAVRDIRRRLEDLHLRIAAVSFPTRHGYNVLQGLEQRTEATRQAMRLAYQLGSPIVVNHVGRVPSDATDPAWQLLVEVLTDLAHYGERAGALLAARTGTESPADLQRLLQALPAGLIGVDLDPGELAMNGYSPLEAVERLGTHILHVHARDGVRDPARGRGTEVELGQGEVDFPALLGALEERDYRGFFTLQRTAGTDPVLEIHRGVKFLRNL
jgi:sugar phosphate isomerase/epimerase